MRFIYRAAVALLATALIGALVPSLSHGDRAPQPPRVASDRVELRLEGTRVVKLPIVASHVTLSWADGDAAAAGEEGHETALAIAFSADGVAFGPEHAVEHDDTGGQVAGRAHSGVMWTGGARFVRLTSSEPIEQLTVVAIDAGSAAAAPAFGTAVAAAAVDEPQVISRAGWGANENLRFWQPGESGGAVVGEEKWPPMFFAVQKLIVHHTAGINDDPDPAATVRAIYHYQAIERGWGDIGYNFLIDEAGRIYHGRYAREYGAGELPNGEDIAGDSVQGAHVANFNSGTIGIALLGHLVHQDATPAARAALEWLLAYLAERHGIDPLGAGLYTNPHPDGTSQKQNPNITGHRDWAATACPGGTFYTTLPALRQAVAERIATGGSPVIPPPGGTPPPAEPPSVPQGLGATAENNFVIKLSWQPSTASVAGTIRYRVFRDGSAIGSLQAATSYTDQRKKANTFRYQVRAVDAAGNKSALSPPVVISSVKDAGATPPPAVGPSVPQGLSASALSGYRISLAWQPSSSSTPGTIRYRVFRNGKAIGSQQTGTTFLDQRRKVNTFSYQVRAIDAAGNKSALSPPVTVTSKP